MLSKLLRLRNNTPVRSVYSLLKKNTGVCLCRMNLAKFAYRTYKNYY